jgi:hypothetical protein
MTDQPEQSLPLLTLPGTQEGPPTTQCRCHVAVPLRQAMKSSQPETDRAFPSCPGRGRGTAASAHPYRTVSTQPSVALPESIGGGRPASAPTPGTAGPQVRTDRFTTNGRIRGHADHDDVLCNIRTGDERTRTVIALERSGATEGLPVEDREAEHPKTADPGPVRSHYTEGR